MQLASEGVLRRDRSLDSARAQPRAKGRSNIWSRVGWLLLVAGASLACSETGTKSATTNFVDPNPGGTNFGSAVPTTPAFWQDASLQPTADTCFGGGADACDKLRDSPNPDYSAYGQSCGRRLVATEVKCVTIFDGDRIPDAAEPPVVASVDPNAADCRAGSLLACDNLRSSPVPEYVQYGTKCGDRNIEVGSCVTTYGANQLPPPSDSASIGRDPGLDQLVPECQSGDAAACNGLRTKANSGTGYSALGLTCGGTRNADSTDCPTTPTPASTEALSTESETVATRAITLDSAPATTAPITVVLTNPPATPTTTVSIIPVRTDPSPATTTQHVESVPPTNPVAVSTVPIDPQDAALLTQAVGVLEATTPTVNWQADKVTVGKQTDVNVVVDTSHLQAGFRHYWKIQG